VTSIDPGRNCVRCGGPTPDSKALAHNIAHLVDRYFQNATESDRGAITNLAGLLRHATAYTAALTRELEEWAKAESAALDERDEALRLVDELTEELDQLRTPQSDDDDALVRGLQ
jgi:acetyl-CoA carboxylase alpha subunit